MEIPGGSLDGASTIASPVIPVLPIRVGGVARVVAIHRGGDTLPRLDTYVSSLCDHAVRARGWKAEKCSDAGFVVEETSSFRLSLDQTFQRVERAERVLAYLTKQVGSRDLSKTSD